MVLSVLLLLACGGVFGAAFASGAGNVDILVSFGDSYTDEYRALYTAKHGYPPVPGIRMPENNHTANGGYAWGRLVAEAAGVEYYNYAVAGSTCSEKIATQPARVIPGQIPTVFEYQVPTFVSEAAIPGFYHDRRADNTLYTMWVGTNDVGIEGFLHDRNVNGTTLSSLVDCVWDSFDRIYATGGRRFVVMNMVPLEKSPLYASLESGGVSDTPTWSDKSNYNTSEYENKMFQYSHAVNDLWDYSTPFHLLVKQRWPGAEVAVFDAHSILEKIRNNPTEYLTAPFDVTSSYKTCNGEGECQYSALPISSFMWYVVIYLFRSIFRMTRH